MATSAGLVGMSVWQAVRHEQSRNRGRKPTMAKANGIILWQGISRLDNRTPIVAIATGLNKASENTKTGDMIQTWILRTDMNPSAAAYEIGMADSGICGEGENRCPLAKNADGERACYVKVFNAPRSIFAAYSAGSYQTWDGSPIAAGRMVRLGSYGDPAAVPAYVWKNLLVGSQGHTGYTHQWRDVANAEYQTLVMASVESSAGLTAAESAGWRAFYVAPKGETPTESLIHCPASVERGHRLTCADCGACSGANSETANRRSVWIQQHS